MEGKKNRREWVKNAAIIFLVVMLVLTFFSQTIMNWSLPEVSGQYCGYGTIASSIRGTGAVAANMSYSVQISESREISSVEIKVGDIVTAGQTLFTLADTESKELKDAQAALSEMEYNYAVKLLQNMPEDYTQSNQEIANLREDLAEAIADRDAISVNESAYQNAKAAYESAKSVAEEWDELVLSLQEEINSAGENTNDLTIVNLTQQLENAKKAKTDAEAYLAACQQKVTQLESQMSGDYESLRNTVETLSRAIASAEQELKYLEEDYNRLLEKQVQMSAAKTAMDEAKAALDALPEDDPGYAQALSTYNSAAAHYQSVSVSDAEVTGAKRAVERAEMDLANQRKDLQAAQANLNSAGSMNSTLTAAKAEVTTAQNYVNNCAQGVTNAQTALDRAIASLTADLKSRLNDAKAAQKQAQAAMADAQDAMEDAAANNGMTLDQANETIKSLQRQIESAVQALAQQQQSDNNADQLHNLELERDQDAIDAQKALIEKLKSNGIGTAVTSKYAGTVTSVNCVTGDTVTPDTMLAGIDVEGKGYTLSISVTNEQASQVNVGDKATVDNYWYGAIDVTLTAIKADRSNPGRGKILEFTVTGDVVDGQNLEISIGERQTAYNIVVPNSAIKEDSNGTFVLIAQAKNTPLGNRYIATRVDVTVLAKDNYHSAIDIGSEYGLDYVITTTSEPLVAGTQVRLVDNE